MKGNAGECQGNVQEWRQSARGTQRNAGECRGIQGNARGTYESGCKVPGECWGMPQQRMGVVQCQGNAGNAGECQGNIWEWVQSARGM